jgi:hypothetical protein
MTIGAKCPRRQIPQVCVRRQPWFIFDAHSNQGRMVEIPETTRETLHVIIHSNCTYATPLSSLWITMHIIGVWSTKSEQWASGSLIFTPVFRVDAVSDIVYSSMMLRRNNAYRRYFASTEVKLLYQKRNTTSFSHAFDFVDVALQAFYQPRCIVTMCPQEMFDCASRDIVHRYLDQAWLQKMAATPFEVWYFAALGFEFVL